ncbi:hypothetical protein POM88_022954 [Heracleum sosnowskyi]|uniref:RRM domain-containing protein n=1 Tax=Heracleum sosnowskyi TaxID=360622 RepID=A0AAD8MU55_9APIA|nr:hypothetical protein POM88_022954 [Heracleum sosnowskyi]
MKRLASSGARNFRGRAINQARSSRTANRAGERKGSRTSLFVANLPQETNIMTRLRDHFQQFGTIKKNGLYVRMQPNSTLYGYVHFLEEAAVDRALEAVPWVIGNNSIRVERLFLELYGVFTTELPVNHELVVSLYYDEKDRVLKSGIQGYWLCNIINSEVVITHQNKEKVHPMMAQQIRAMVKTKVEAMGQVKAGLWKGRGRESAVKNLIHQTRVQNLYEGNIFNPDAIEEATELASPYTDLSDPRSLVACFLKFKTHLAKKIKGSQNNEKIAMDLFFEFVADHYERYLRITVKNANQIDFGFMSDKDKNAIHHSDDVPKGSPADFSTFCHAIDCADDVAKGSAADFP